MNSLRIVPLLLAAASFVAAQDARFARVEEILRRLDADGDGAITRAEAKSDDFMKKYDSDRNGKVGAAEILLVEGGAVDRRSRQRLFGEIPQIDRFDQIPFCDADGDARLDVDELKVLVFSACDRSPRDGRIEPAEAFGSPAPFDAGLRTGWLAKEFKRLDRNADGVLLMRDLELPDALMKGLDKDGDGRASFDELVADEMKKLGGTIATFESAATYFLKNDAMRAVNWQGENDLFRRLDENRDGVLAAAEFDRHVRRVRTTLALASTFLVRFDLDGDRRVSRAEFGASDLIFARLDLDGDGYVTAKDAKLK